MMRDYRVLIVEDDAIDRMLYRKLLTQLGANVTHIHHAVDADAGLLAMRLETFDCVLLDFNLPGMNGFDFLAAAVVDGELPCAVVLITGQGSEVLAVEAMKRGVQDYLVKDQLNANSLWRAVTQAVSQVELRQRLSRSLLELTAANHALEKEAAVRKAAEEQSRAAKEAAEQANESKTRFVAMVTHELRTPLNGILGYAQLLRLEGGLAPRQDAQIGKMMQAGQHLLEMIDQILDFAGIETGRLHLRLKPVIVADLIEECSAVIDPLVIARGLDLRVVNTHGAPRQIVGDQARLRQVLLNLLSNAVKYTEAGSVELRVLPGATPGALRVEVADTGPGIDAANRERVFQEFERLKTTDAVEGAGLGLAIAARLVNLMGGTIDYRPNPHGGTIFWVDIPPGRPAAAPLDPSGRVTSVPGRKVLLVDDIKINLDIIGSFLEAAGYVVTTAGSGEESVRLATDHRYDLILMDVRMPAIDGLKATQCIRKLPGKHGRVPILALTAYESLDEIARCLDADMDGHVTKPVRYETLIRMIEDTIASCQIRA